MTIAPWGVAEDITRACFRSLRQLPRPLGAAHPRLKARNTLHGHERRLSPGHRRRRYTHPHRHRPLRQARPLHRSRPDAPRSREGVTLAVRAPARRKEKPPSPASTAKAPQRNLKSPSKRHPSKAGPTKYSWDSSLKPSACLAPPSNSSPASARAAKSCCFAERRWKL